MPLRFCVAPCFANGLLLILLSSYCFPFLASAQQSAYSILTPIDSAEIKFDQIIGSKNVAIVNGPEYRPAFNGRKSHPFFQSSESSLGSVNFDNDLYQHLQLLYDVYSDILVLKCSTPIGSYFITLDKKQVQRFDLHQHHFKKFNYGSSAGKEIYFDVLFEEKKFAVLKRRVKTERIEKGVRDYLENDDAFILNEGKWIKIKGKGSFAKTINKTHRKDLAAFIKSNHIKLSKQKDDDLMKLGAYCYSLKEKE